MADNLVLMAQIDLLVKSFSFSNKNNPTKVQKGKAPIGPSKKTSKLALIIKANKIQPKANFLPVSNFLNKGLNNNTSQYIQTIKIKKPRFSN